MSTTTSDIERASIKVSDLAVLRGIKSLLSAKKRWCQGFSAVNSLGRSVDPGDVSACSWCLLGAIELTSIINGRSPYHITGLVAAGRDRRHINAGRSLDHINDYYGLKAVRHTINTAIRRARAA